MKALKLTLYFCAFSIVLSACGKSGGSGAGDTTKSNDLTYYLSDGTCFRASTNQSVSNTNCENLDFFIEDGDCFRDSNNERVSINNCTGNSFFAGRGVCYNQNSDRVDTRNCVEDSGGNTTSRQRVCSGPHLQFLRDDILEGECDGIRDEGNCSGALLFSIEDQMWVDCL